MYCSSMRWEGITPTVPAHCWPKHPLARQRGNIGVMHFATKSSFPKVWRAQHWCKGQKVYHKTGPSTPSSQSTCIIELSFRAQHREH